MTLVADRATRARDVTLEQRIERALPFVVGALAALQVAVLAWHLGHIVAFPYDLNYGEGYVLNDAVRLSRGESIYVDLQQFPMIRSPYPPLYPWLVSLGVPLAGAVFWPARALSVVATLGIGVLVAWHARRATRDWLPAVAAVGLVAASPWVYDWAAYARVDMLALAFALGGVLAAQWVGGWRGTLLAALGCGLALWTKQTTATAAVAVGIALLLRAPRRGLAFVGLIAVPSVIVGGILNAATHGEFVHHVLQGNASNPIMPVRAMVYVGALVIVHLPALVAGVWWLRRAITPKPSPVALYLLLSLIAAFSAGNGGSSVNYLIEPVIALALTVPFAWRALPPHARALGPLLACVQLALLLHWPNGFGTSFLAESALGHTPTSEDAAIGAQLDALIRATAGEVIAEPAGFAVRNGREVYLQPIDLRAEQLQGRWQSGPLVDALSRGRFAVVLTAYNLFPADAERAIAAHFNVSDSLPGPDGLTFTVYRYQP